MGDFTIKATIGLNSPSKLYETLVSLSLIGEKEMLRAKGSFPSFAP